MNKPQGPITRTRAHSLPFHYGWLVMAAGTLCLFAALGLGRFSFGMLLPSMGEALDLRFAEMGFISTANFIGYLAAVLLSGRMMQLFGARKVIAAALLLVGASMMLISQARSMPVITALYVVTGIGSAMANVPVMALVSAWFCRNRRGRAAGFVVIGNGLGILLCGRLIPYLGTVSNTGWRLGWLLLGAIVLGCALLCYLVFRNSPEEMGLSPIGAEREKAPGSTLAPPPSHTPIRSRMVYHCATVYFLFGFTYVIYVTFVVTAMVEDLGYAESAAGVFWSWVGLISLVSGPLPGAVSDRFGRRATLTGVFLIQATAYLLVALPLPEPFLFLSIFCYGIVAWSVPSIISALVADIAAPQRVAAIFGFVTFIFGLGQISGPFIAGLLADYSGTFASSFLLAAALALTAALLAALLPGRGVSSKK